MFKSVRWRGDQNKFKAEFKLQFHAAQLSQSVGDELAIYVIPADRRKPSVNSDRAKVRDGTCQWKNPIYLTMKLVRDPKTGKIDEKIYDFVVSTRSKNEGVVGKVSVNFSDYANTRKPSFISLPLRDWDFEDILHVEIQNLQGNAILRERFQDKGLKTNLCDTDEDDEVDGSHWICNTPRNGGSSGSDITRACSSDCFEEENQMGWLLGSDCEENTDASPDEMFCRERSRKLDAVLKLQRGKMEDLVKEITSVKEERDDLKADYEKLKAAFQNRSNGGKFKMSTAIEDRDLRNFIDEIKQELNHEKETNSNLRLQLEKTQESNSELILAVQDLEKILEKKSELKDRDSLNGHLQTLEEELEKQARGFESDLEALTKEKIEQEKRAIEAEKSLRKIRRENAITAEKLQEELKKLSMEIAATFESNQKVAKNAIAEANMLRKEVNELKEDAKKRTKLVEVNGLKSDEAWMERELKEMEERYSELSLKFAEVEGERQELVMALRRNSTKLYP